MMRKKNIKNILFKSIKLMSFIKFRYVLLFKCCSFYHQNAV